jgi:hypothetical protein
MVTLMLQPAGHVCYALELNNSSGSSAHLVDFVHKLVVTESLSEPISAVHCIEFSDFECISSSCISDGPGMQLQETDVVLSCSTVSTL